jgi:acyl-phosphate glycerol 3-phosphate acyltransferase
MQGPGSIAVVALAAYLVGAMPFGYLIGRWRGVDVLREGSQNIGATNVARLLGIPWGVFVFFLDAAKGAGPVLWASSLTQPESLLPGTLPVVAGIAAFLGHLFPIYLGFRGGKGVATGAGVVAMLLPVTALAALVVWAALLSVTRYVSLASIGAAVGLFGLRLGFTPHPWDQSHLIVTLFCLLGGVLVAVRHQSNLRRLLHGTEHRLPDTLGMLTFTKIIHVLALGLWFGTAVFFTLTGVVLSRTFADLSQPEAASREPWFPLPEEYNRPTPSARLPTPLRLEQGSRVFGAAVAPLFPWYFGIQAGCAALAAATALGWAATRPSRLNRARAVLLTAALATVALGWWLEQRVHALREPRNAKTDALIASRDPTSDQIQAADQARIDFGRWHGFSLMANFATLLLLTPAMALAAGLPGPGTCGQLKPDPLAAK